MSRHTILRRRDNCYAKQIKAYSIFLTTGLLLTYLTLPLLASFVTHDDFHQSIVQRDVNAAQALRQSVPSLRLPCITFLGDTMLANSAKKSQCHPQECLHYIRPLIQKCSIVIANLEGPITHLGLDHDPLHKSWWYSFNMNPDILPHFLLEEGIGFVNRANNHLRDRGEDGVEDTTRHLNSAGIRFFGSGRTKQDAAKPLLFTMNNTAKTKIGVTGYSEFYSRGVLPDPELNQSGVLPVTTEHVQLGRRLLDEHDAELRVAFVHWGRNYQAVSRRMMKQAKQLVEVGRYDLIIGSDGSHTVQKVEYVNQVPVLYNIGNFLFQTPGRFKDSPVLPFGLIVHVHLDQTGRRFERIELECSQVDNIEVHFQPRMCTREQSALLFSRMGSLVEHQDGDNFGSIKCNASHVV